MSQFTDEQIQQLLEAGKSLPDMNSAGQASEARLYQQLFKELNQDLPIEPDADFSSRVMSRIDKLSTVSNHSVSYNWLWLGLCVCLLIVMLVVTPVDWIVTDLMNVLALLNPMRWGLGFGILSLLVVQLLDFKLIRAPFLAKLS